MVAELPIWDLSEILPKGMEHARRELEERVAAFELWKPKLTTLAPEDILPIADAHADLTMRISKIYRYAHLRFSENTKDQEAAAGYTSALNFITAIGNRRLFLDQWVKDLPDDIAQRLINASGFHRHYFELIRMRKPYMLGESEEKIVNLKNANGFEALNKVYAIITSAFTYPVQGQQLTRDELTIKCKDPSPAIREEAYRALHDKHRACRDVLGEIYRAIVTDWREEHVTLRKQAQPIHARNLMNDLPNEAVEAVIRVTERNFPIFHRFFALKKKKLGIQNFTRYDIYAPISAKPHAVQYDEAVSLISESFKSFSPTLEHHAMEMFRQQHVHARIQPNKRTGAFCSFPGTDMLPYVHVNYAGNVHDARTLAHEIGHAVHFILASKQSPLTTMPGLPIAETASTFAETVFSDYLMKQQPERGEELLFRQLDDAYLNIVRQIGFVKFELEAHELIKQGKTLDELDKAYIKGLRGNVGPSVHVDDMFGSEWYGIPHIYQAPFYCYSYPFGMLLAYSLYERFRKEGQNAVPGILEFFAAGGSESAVGIARKVGADITSDEFWQQGFDFLDGTLKYLEAKN